MRSPEKEAAAQPGLGSSRRSPEVQGALHGQPGHEPERQ